MDHLTSLPDAEFPPRYSKVRNEVKIMAVLLGLLCLVAVVTALSSRHTRPVLSPAEAVAKRAALQKALAPPESTPDPDAWDEKRDGNGALEIEDTNGQGTIFVDGPSKTRVLCVSGSSCVMLPNPKPVLPAAAPGKTPPKP